MAEEVAQRVAAQQAQEDVVVVADVPQPEKMTPTPPPSLPVVEKEAPPLPDTEEEEGPLKPKLVEDAVESDQVSKPSVDIDDKIPESVAFKEESTKFADLLDSEKKALEELRKLVQEALNKHEFSGTKQPPSPKLESQENHPPAQEQKKQTQEAEPQAIEEEQKIEMVETEVSGEKVATAAVDADGAKTVEAIEETVVAVSSAPQEQKVEKEEKAEEAKEVKLAEEISIWGIPLLQDERSDVILLKFLRARDFKVREAFTMLKKTIQWRKEFGIDELIEQDLGNELGKAVFMHGFDKLGHPVCYNVYGEFQDKELYQKSFSDEEKRNRFLRWRIQFLERSIRKLDFSPGGISTIVQVNDLKNSPGPSKKELRQATKQALQLLQDNYPEFVAKQVFINVPWWYLAVNRMINPFLTQRTRSKFVFAGPSKSAETLLRYVAAEQLPVKYGGLSKDGEFGTADAVTEITLKPAAKHAVEFPVSERCNVSWEVRVVGWDVTYGAEFVPSAEESYTVIIQKARKVDSSEEPVVSNSLKIGEPGKVVLTIDNPTSKKKKLLYRLKAMSSSD